MTNVPLEGGRGREDGGTTTNGRLIFDGDCGFCTRGRDVLARVDRHSRINLVPFQHPGVVEATGIPAEELMATIWWVGEDGARYRAAEAVNAALSALIGNRLPLWLYRLPGIRSVQEWLYRTISANRHRLPGTTPWCRKVPTDCGR